MIPLFILNDSLHSFNDRSGQAQPQVLNTAIEMQVLNGLL